ncbi:MAG: PF20097 family protein [Tissierellia bacterium]|nr:PF20097 family protein [Tissierellia bacterium]
MICPWFENEMIVGVISQDRYAIKWVPLDHDKGIFNFTLLVNGIKITSMSEDIRAKVF